MFWLEEGLPSIAWRPAAARVPRSRPTLVLRDGAPVLAFGTPGGDQQDQWQLLFLLRHLVGGLDLQEAIDAPTWHTNVAARARSTRASCTPAGLVVEDRLGAGVLDELARRGHDVTRRAGDGRSAGCRPSPATPPPATCAPRPTRGVSRATRSAAEPGLGFAR